MKRLQDLIAYHEKEILKYEKEIDMHKRLLEKLQKQLPSSVGMIGQDITILNCENSLVPIGSKGKVLAIKDVGYEVSFQLDESKAIIVYVKKEDVE